MRIPKSTYTLPLAAMLLGGFGTSGLQAQEGFSYALRMRMGLTAGDMQTTHFDNKIFGFGLEVRKDNISFLPMLFSNGQALSAEIAWEYVPGRSYNALRPLNGEVLNVRDNLDIRKEYGQGFSYKLAYNAPLKWLPNTEWYAGVSLDMHSVHTEIDYSIYHISAPGDPSKYPGTGWPSTWPEADRWQGNSFVEQSTAIVPGVFAGIRYQLSQIVFGELTLRNFGMSHHDFTPGIYLSSTEDRIRGKMDSGTSRGWSLEFSLSVKF